MTVSHRNIRHDFCSEYVDHAIFAHLLHRHMVILKGQSMIILALPLGFTFGWGVCGKYLTKEIAELSVVKLITQPFDRETIGDELDYILLKNVYVDKNSPEFGSLDNYGYPVIQAITDHNLLPMEPEIIGKPNIGYTFFEHSILSKQNLEKARRNFDIVVAGSSWCQDVLNQHGLENTRKILQGVDRTIFNPCENEKTFFHDTFVVFSGGKFEFRKGQDLVIRAFKVLQDRHKDVLLINSWFNHWEFSMRTMAVSPYIHFDLTSKDCCIAINNILVNNGIDISRVITLPPKSNTSMSRIYKNTDCGLFPNRCEGGTNLVLMEYISCGKPAIVANSSGHRDVTTDQNAIMLKHLRPITISNNQRAVAEWDDPDLEEIVERLEWAYNHRETLRTIGEAAGSSMAQFSWQATARQFYELAVQRDGG